jgi:predicted nucleic acid-binding protein
MRPAMSSPKIRAFLDTDVLLEYLRGKVELQSLFSEDVRQRAAFAINAIVLQELLLARDRTEGGVDLTRVVPYLEVVGAGVDLSSPEVIAELQQLRNRLVHANDVLILAGARSCDVLLTYDRDLLDACPTAAVRSETPEEFLEELGTAA